MTREGLRRLGRAVREGDLRGIAILASRGLLVVRYDRMLVLASPVLEPRPADSGAASLASDLSVREALAIDLDGLSRLFPHNASRYAERMRLGDQCLLILRGADVIGMTWIGFDLDAPRELGCAIHMPVGSCWEYDTFVLPEHRSLGAFAFLMRELFRRLPARGIGRVFAAVGHLNRASRVAHGRLGFTAAGAIDRCLLLGIPFIRATDTAGEVAWSRGGGARQPVLRLPGGRNA